MRRDKIKLSFSIIAHNEEKNIKRCLESIKWADEIILVDCESNDKTVEIAKRYNVKIFKRKNNPNLNINKSFGISKAKGEWIFYIDPDEVITKELKREIIEVINSNTEYNGFKLPRLNFYAFNFLRHGGNYPDTQLRLFRKGKARFPNKHVHERIEVEGKVGRLKNYMLHYPYNTVAEYINKINFYTDFQVDYWIKKGKSINKFKFIYNITYKPLQKFFERFFLKAGFLDGVGGFFAAFTNSVTHIINYLKFYEYIKKKK